MDNLTEEQNTSYKNVGIRWTSEWDVFISPRFMGKVRGSSNQRTFWILLLVSAFKNFSSWVCYSNYYPSSFLYSFSDHSMEVDFRDLRSTMPFVDGCFGSFVETFIC